MSTGIHRYAYSEARPTTPNTTEAPLGLAPGATVDVYLTGSFTHAALFTDQALTTPLANPFTSDVNAFYAYFVDPALGDVDEAFSGTGIVTPYTLAKVICLDPRVGGSAGDITALQAALSTETSNRIAADNTLQANINTEAATRAAADSTLTTNLNAEIANRTAAIAALTAIGTAYDLGGSLSDGQASAAQMPAYNRRVVSIDGTKYAGYTLTVVATCYTSNAGTTIQPILRNLTNATNAGVGAATAVVTPTLQTFTATITAGVNLYELEGLASNATNPVYWSGYAILTK